MPISERRAKELAQALRRGAWNGIIAANDLHHESESEFVLQLSQDWQAIKTIIAAKDTALAALEQQNATQQQQLADKDKQIADLTAKLPDAADVTAAAEIHQVATAAPAA